MHTPTYTLTYYTYTLSLSLFITIFLHCAIYIVIVQIKHHCFLLIAFCKKEIVRGVYYYWKQVKLLKFLLWNINGWKLKVDSENRKKRGYRARKKNVYVFTNHEPYGSFHQHKWRWNPILLQYGEVGYIWQDVRNGMEHQSWFDQYEDQQQDRQW